jgi:signal transduction histidine kinase
VLTGIALKTKALQGKLADSGSSQALETEEIVNLINGAIAQTRRLARGLDPVEIEASGLIAALGNLAAETQEVFAVACEFLCCEQALSVNDQAGLALYRITQEAIHNATSHGGARHIKIELNRNPEQVSLRISDDGRGFQPGRVKTTGMGLRIMGHRARSISGVLTVSSRPRRGTTIECSVPAVLCLVPARGKQSLRTVPAP